MKIFGLALILFAAIFNTGASVFLKNFSQHHSILNLLLSILFYSLNFIFFYFALKTISLNIAYPLLVGLSVILISICSLYFFHERITLLTILGIAFVLLGVFLIYHKY